MEVIQLKREVQELKQENLLLRQELALLQKLIFSSKSERFVPDTNHHNFPYMERHKGKEYLRGQKSNISHRIEGYPRINEAPQNFLTTYHRKR